MSAPASSTNGASQDGAAPPPLPSPPPARISLCWAFDIRSFPHAAHSAAVDAILDTIGMTEAANGTEPVAAIAAEKKRIMRFHFEHDRIRALTAKCAIASTLSAITGSSLGDLRLARSYYGKPFLVEPSAWRRKVAFNASHHGDWVVLTLEAAAARSSKEDDPSSVPLLGCDVTTHHLPKNCSSAAEYLSCFAENFTRKEWELIRWTEEDGEECKLLEHPPRSSAASSCSECQLVRFAWLWSLKESLIKAIGMGLSFQLQHIEFTPLTAARRLFSPIGVRFLGAPEFDAAPSSSSPSPVLRNPSAASPAAPPRPADLDGIENLATDVQWEFQSTMLRDKRHIVTRCKGWKRGAKTTPRESVASGSASFVASSASVSSVQPSDMEQLSETVSLHPSIPSQLQVRQLSYEQILPLATMPNQ
jgi:phosphopantetheinyl transferase